MNVFVFLTTLDLPVSCRISWLKGWLPEYPWAAVHHGRDGLRDEWQIASVSHFLHFISLPGYQSTFSNFIVSTDGRLIWTMAAVHAKTSESVMCKVFFWSSNQKSPPNKNQAKVVSRQLDEDRVKRRHLPLISQPISSMIVPIDQDSSPPSLSIVTYVQDPTLSTASHWK